MFQPGNVKAAWDIKETTVEGVDEIINSWNLPAEVSEFLKFIKFVEK